MKAGKDYVGLGCGAFIVNDNNELLMLKRTDECRNEAGKWNIPGGGVDFGEKAEDAIVREIKEELDIDIKIEEFMFYIDHMVPDDEQHWVALVFKSRIVGGELKNLEPEKHSEIKWWSLDELPYDNLAVSVKLMMEKLK